MRGFSRDQRRPSLSKHLLILTALRTKAFAVMSRPQLGSPRMFVFERVHAAPRRAIEKLEHGVPRWTYSTR